METLKNLLLLYASIIVFNMGLSGTLWLKNRVYQYKLLFFLWFTTFISFVLSGMFQQGNLAIVLSSASMIFMSLSMAHIVASLSNQKVPTKLFFFLFFLSLPFPFIFHYLNKPFVYLALPVCVAVVYPGFHMAVKAVRNSWSELTFSAKGLVLTTFLITLHHLDFAFLRDKPEFMLVGFTVAFIIFIFQSIFAPASIFEKVAAEKSRIQTEINLARDIQQKSLPEAPSFDGLDILTSMTTADEVGGDFFDFHKTDNQLWVFVGDVTGHGLGAGLGMVMAQSVISTLLETVRKISPQKLNFLLNNIFYEHVTRRNESLVLTLATIQFLSSRKLIVSGSHDPILVYKNSSKMVEQHDVDQIPAQIGLDNLWEENDFSQKTVDLEPGDLLFVTTDGVYEIPIDGNFEKGLLGIDGIKKILNSIAHLEIHEIQRELIKKIRSVSGNTQIDDMTFVLIKVK